MRTEKGKKGDKGVLYQNREENLQCYHEVFVKKNGQAVLLTKTFYIIFV